VFTFVGLGFDHVIANMFFIPMAIFVGAPEPLTVTFYIWKSLIPALIGNAIGGGLFVGVLYWYLYLAGNEVPIHFDNTPMDTAVYEQGGPLHQHMTSTGAGTGYGTQSNGHGPEIKDGHAIPDSGNRGVSGLARDLHGKMFKKEKTSSDTSA
jgi:hypothetical protein